MEHLLLPGIRDTHSTLDHRYPRISDPTADGEDGASNGNAAIFREDIKMSAGPLCRLNQDVAAFKMHGCIFASLADRELCALIHLHARTIHQTEKCVPTIGGTNNFILSKLVSGTYRLFAVG